MRTRTTRQLAAALEEVRSGRVSDDSWALLASLARRPRDPLRPPTSIVPTNRQADALNAEAMARLEPREMESFVPTSARVHFGSTSGRVAGGYGLGLCVGAQLVLTRTVCVGPDDVCVPNGTRCQVTGFVQLARHLYDMRRHDFDPDTAIQPWQRQFILQHDGRLPRVVPIWGKSSEFRHIGEEGFVLYPELLDDASSTSLENCDVQLPVRLGWALTAHRAQGLSLDGAVSVHLQGLFSAGQAYVALSRARSSADLWIRGLPARDRTGVVKAFLPDAKVAAFYARLRGADA
eukprot:TRINITY_DN4300_c0_g1_i2.p1 TRINITY_DN4300_c0_g1~~TRINITY_DN4300_c0_g1_i2.p1  ORF type:complete len:291 (-),score=47.23 TRINITY_DN4300_c0_g1_i2:456-1328(-)